jgi:transcriptional regulator with XRE-family HTH domain
MDMRRHALGGRIKKARQQRGWYQRELASAVHVQPQTISNWERGVSAPGLAYLALLARALEVPISALLDDADSGTDEQPSTASVSAAGAEPVDRLEAAVAQIVAAANRLSQLAAALEPPASARAVERQR